MNKPFPLVLFTQNTRQLFSFWPWEHKTWVVEQYNEVFEVSENAILGLDTLDWGSRYADDLHRLNPLKIRV